MKEKQGEPDYELDKYISWLKMTQRTLKESEDALEKLDELQKYGHWTLDIDIGGSTSGPGGNGYHGVKVVLDFLDDEDAKTRQVALFASLRAILRYQIDDDRKKLVLYRKRIKELA